MSLVFLDENNSKSKLVPKHLYYWNIVCYIFGWSVMQAFILGKANCTPSAHNSKYTHHTWFHMENWEGFGWVPISFEMIVAQTGWIKGLWLRRNRDLLGCQDTYPKSAAYDIGRYDEYRWQYSCILKGHLARKEVAEAVTIITVRPPSRFYLCIKHLHYLTYAHTSTCLN